MEQEQKGRDWELLRIFVFLAVLTIGLVTALRWVAMTPVANPASVRPAVLEPAFEQPDRAPAEN